jgi:muconolactone delta-isomerase
LTVQFMTISQRRPEFAGQPDANLVEEEQNKARELYTSGAIRQIWHRADRPGACILWEAGSEEEVLALFHSLPFTQAGMTEVTVVPLKPYAGFRPR